MAVTPVPSSTFRGSAIRELVRRGGRNRTVGGRAVRFRHTSRIETSRGTRGGFPGGRGWVGGQPDPGASSGRTERGGKFATCRFSPASCKLAATFVPRALSC